MLTISLIKPSFFSSLNKSSFKTGILQSEKEEKKDISAILTPRQLQVAKLVVKGLTNQQIAEALNLSQSTIENYMSALLDRLGIKRREELSTFFPANTNNEQDLLLLLSDTEKQIMKYIIEHPKHSYKEVGKNFNIGETTVLSHINNIKNKVKKPLGYRPRNIPTLINLFKGYFQENQ